jgi:CDP-6-deoxy-D-xylo-4-hexulose-3-dehydrase
MSAEVISIVAGVPMPVHYARAVYGEEEMQAVASVLKDQPLLLMNGPKVADFEHRISRVFGKTHGVMTNSGSSANTLAVAAAQLSLGAEVVTPALTFSTTVAPIVQQQLVPVFVDVLPGTYNIDTSAIRGAIGPKTEALMVPNLIGNLADWRLIREVADEHGLFVIEDSCDTIGSTFDGQPVGSLSDIATTSFYASHIITAGGFGGMATTTSQELFERMVLLRGWGRASSLTHESERPDDRFSVEVDGIPYDAKFEFPAIGYNFLPSEMGAAFGLVQLERLDEFKTKRNRNFAALFQYFEQFEEWFILPQQDPRADTSWLAFPLTIRPGAPFTRREFQLYFEAEGIQTRVIFTGNIVRQPGFESIKRREHGPGFPNADDVMRGGVLLGAHHGMGPAEVEHMTQVFDRFAKASGAT